MLRFGAFAQRGGGDAAPRKLERARRFLAEAPGTGLGRGVEAEALGEARGEHPLAVRAQFLRTGGQRGGDGIECRELRGERRGLVQRAVALGRGVEQRAPVGQRVLDAGERHAALQRGAGLGGDGGQLAADRRAHRDRIGRDHGMFGREDEVLAQHGDGGDAEQRDRREQPPAPPEPGGRGPRRRGRRLAGDGARQADRRIGRARAERGDDIVH